MVERQHLQKEIFSRTEKENRVESLPSPNSKKFGCLPQLQAAYISATALFNVLYYETQTCLTGRQHFMQAHIFVDLEYFIQVQLFLGLRIIYVRRGCFLNLEYFMSADIFNRRRHFRAPTFCLGRRHFRAPTFCIGRRHFRAPTFSCKILFCMLQASANILMILQLVLPVYFCNKFLL